MSGIRCRVSSTGISTEYGVLGTRYQGVGYRVPGTGCRVMMMMVLHSAHLLEIYSVVTKQAEQIKSVSIEQSITRKK